MRRAYLLAVVGAVLVVAFAGVALAAVITCTGGPCQGTNEPDQITGSAVRDVISALNGDDVVSANVVSPSKSGTLQESSPGGYL